MKLPPFEEFMDAMADGKFDFEDYAVPVNLPENPHPDQVVEYAKVAGRLAALKVMRQYHAWLCDQPTMPETRT